MMNSSPGTGESPESTEREPTHNMEGLSGTEISRESAGAGESGESTGTEEIQKTTGTEETLKSTGTEETPKSTGTEEIQESTGAEATQKSTETKETPQSIDTTIQTMTEHSGTDGESAPLDSQTGALVPVQDLPHTSLLQWIRSLFGFSQTRQTDSLELAQNPPQTSWWPWPPSCFQGSQTREEEPAPDEPVVGKVKTFQENIDKIREIIESTYTTLGWYLSGYVSGYHTVEIFSRSSESDYEWLIKQLKSKPFQSTVSAVHDHYISNNGRQKFMEAVSQCSFGILYHTKNRGRINIVDVTDSLYDEELKYMSERLGKDNVIVVIDDLEDTSEEQKSQILETQPSIGRLAKEILLFNSTDKKKVTVGE